ncbi:MAG TPA: hypothetical protein VND93_22420 [Myxococcales bacterium]|nr:hypothetical protein [Myxococcales bacterium]
MRARLLWRLCAVAVAAAGCSKVQEQDATLEQVQATSPALPPMVDPELQGGHVGRAPRRLTVDQLDQSITVAVGRRWTGIDQVAASLGKADFAMSVTEGADPNMVFAKFLEDGARTVCLAQAQADIAATTAATRVLARELPDNITNLTTLTQAQIKLNLSYLSTRFWGEPLQGAELDAWAALFTQLAMRAQGINRREQALAATCIALVTDPRFLTY